MNEGGSGFDIFQNYASHFVSRKAERGGAVNDLDWNGSSRCGNRD